MKYVDATTYKLLSHETVVARARAAKTAPEMVVYGTHLMLNTTVDINLCSDEQFLEVACNILVVH